MSTLGSTFRDALYWRTPAWLTRAADVVQRLPLVVKIVESLFGGSAAAAAAASSAAATAPAEPGTPVRKGRGRSKEIDELEDKAVVEMLRWDNNRDGFVSLMECAAPPPNPHEPRPPAHRPRIARASPVPAAVPTGEVPSCRAPPLTCLTWRGTMPPTPHVHCVLRRLH